MLKAGTAARRRSLSWDEAPATESVRSNIEAFLRRLDTNLQARDPAWVGHCKLLIAAPSGSAYASITAANDDIRWAGTLQASTSAELTIYVAIYNWSDGDVAAVLDESLAAAPIVAHASVAAG